MSNKVRYKLATNYKLKKTHKKMVNNFEVRQVSTAKLKNNAEFIYFSVKEAEEQERIEKFLNGLGIKYERIKD